MINWDAVALEYEKALRQHDLADELGAAPDPEGKRKLKRLVAGAKAIARGDDPAKLAFEWRFGNL